MCVSPPVIQDTKEALENVTGTLRVLQDGTAQLQSDLSRVQMDISNSLDDPVCADSFSHAVHICVNILSSLSQLEIGANYSAVRFNFSLMMNHLIIPIIRILNNL